MWRVACGVWRVACGAGQQEHDTRAASFSSLYLLTHHDWKGAPRPGGEEMPGKSLMRTPQGMILRVRLVPRSVYVIPTNVLLWEYLGKSENECVRMCLESAIRYHSRGWIAEPNSAHDREHEAGKPQHCSRTNVGERGVPPSNQCPTA